MRLRNQPFRLLVVLASRPGELATREELQRTLWSEDELVDAEQGLNYCVKEIRAALGDSAESPRFVQTLPRRGYRFIADVTRVGDFATTAAVPEGPAPNRAEPIPADSTTGRENKRRLALVAMLGFVGAAALALFATVDARPAIAERRPRARVMVLPFEDLAGSSGMRSPVPALTDELIAQIGLIDPGRIEVLARASADVVRGSRDPVAAARRLGVDYLVEGSIRREAHGFRVVVSLARADDLGRIWTDAHAAPGEAGLRESAKRAAIGIARAIGQESETKTPGR